MTDIRHKRTFARDVAVVSVEIDAARFKRVEEVAKALGLPVPAFMERCVVEATNALWAHLRGHQMTAAGLYIPNKPIEEDVRKPEPKPKPLPHDTNKLIPDWRRAPPPKKKKKRRRRGGRKDRR